MNPYFQRGLMLLQQSRYELAEKELRQALAQSPNDARAHAVLAICLAKREAFPEATREAQNAVHLAPEDPYVFYAQSVVLEAQNHFPEAQAAIETAIGLDPNDPDFHAQLARVHFNQRRWKEALAAAEQGLALDPEDVNCTNLRAMALVKLNRKIEAEASLETALKRDPEDSYSHANLGWSLLEQGKHQQAMEHFREALRLEPTNEWARVGIIEAMKSRFVLYRILLNWFLWMMKLSGRAQWGVILGAYFGYQLLRRIAATNPELSPFITPLLVAYVAFAIMTWVASPLFDLVLRLDRFGRLTLSEEQIRTSNWVGLCVVGTLPLLAAYFLTGESNLLHGALALGLMIPLVSRIYSCSPGWPRAVAVLGTIALGSMALVVIATRAAEPLFTGDTQRVIHGIGSITFLAFLIGAIASQFGANALVAVRPRTQSATAVWWIGGSLLALAGVFFAATFALMIGVTLVDAKG